MCCFDCSTPPSPSPHPPAIGPLPYFFSSFCISIIAFVFVVIFFPFTLQTHCSSSLSNTAFLISFGPLLSCLFYSFTCILFLTSVTYAVLPCISFIFCLSCTFPLVLLFTFLFSFLYHSPFRYTQFMKCE